VSDRSILKYTEERLPHGPYWTLNIERSASGRPDVLVTIRHEDADQTTQQQMTIVVTDADKVFGEIVDWAKRRRAERY
jgi:hypothetical protein